MLPLRVLRRDAFLFSTTAHSTSLLARIPFRLLLYLCRHLAVSGGLCSWRRSGPLHHCDIAVVGLDFLPTICPKRNHA